MKKTIVVVGAGKGLGNAVAQKFGENDFRVILISRNEDNLNIYKKEFEDKGIETIIQKGDASYFNEFKSLLENIIDQYETPNVFFYNVGITIADEQTVINCETLVERYRTDVVGAYNCLKTLDTPEFASNNGCFLITGGGLAIEPYAGYLPLCMDKAALRAMVKALAPELDQRRYRKNQKVRFRHKSI